MLDTLSTFHRSNLPHFTPIGGTFFVTFRIKDSISSAMMGGLRLQYLKEISRIKKQQLPSSMRKLEIAKARYRYFKNYDNRLDRSARLDFPLADPKIAQIVKDKIHSFDGDLYDLIAFCIMPNHVHLLISLGNQLVDENDFYLEETELSLSYRPLHEIMRRIKGSTSREINKVLGKTGTPFWQKDSYDHFVRNQKSFENVWWYILNNPVAAKLSGSVEEFPHTFWR